MIEADWPMAVDLPQGHGIADMPRTDSLSRDLAYRLIRAEGSELVGLMHAASTLRDRHKGRLVTYSRKVFIPLTNLCRDKCGYCTFAKPPGHPDARTMTPDEVLA